MQAFRELRHLGQSFWLDNLSRPLLQSGALQTLVDAGEVSGITTNPSIFKAAIANGTAYRDDLSALKAQEDDPERRYERLAIADVQAACDVLRPVFSASAGDDGYVSLEVSPRLAYDSAGTLAAARRLHAAVGRDNVLIKIPGTPQGAEAFEHCTAEGINVNVTLLFSLGQMQTIFSAYMRGLTRRQAMGTDLKPNKAVASFFMSRIDTLVDQQLTAIGSSQALTLRGQTAVAVGKLAYRRYRQVFEGPDFAALKAAGARPQYLLWASTSTKNVSYPDLLYVEPLIGPQTINTLPDNTLVAFRDHGRVAFTLEAGQEQAQASFDALESLGLDHEAIGMQLQREGVKLFDDAYMALLEAVA
jgi:transaldolase